MSYNVHMWYIEHLWNVLGHVAAVEPLDVWRVRYWDIDQEWLLNNVGGI